MRTDKCIESFPPLYGLLDPGYMPALAGVFETLRHNGRGQRDGGIGGGFDGPYVETEPVDAGDSPVTFYVIPVESQLLL